MSTKPKTTALQAAATAENDTKRTRGVFAAVLSALGIGGKDADRAAAKMTKITERYSEKREKMEESDDDEEEEESDAGGNGTGSGTGDKDSDSGSGSTGTAEEEEEEEASGKGKAKKAAKPAEEEEEARAKAVRAAHREAQAAAQAAYTAVAARYPALAASLALRSPDRVLRAVKRATGAKRIDDAMTALDGMRGESVSAARIAANAEQEARLAALEAEGKAAKVNAIVEKARADGRAGATTKEGRQALREHGMANGEKALTKLVASLPIAARTTARAPREDGEEMDRTATAESEEENLLASMTAGMSEKDAAAFRADYARRLRASANGAARTPRA